MTIQLHQIAKHDTEVNETQSAQKQPQSMLDKLRNLNQQQILKAGPRYTPGIDPSAPNIAITTLQNVIESIGITGKHREICADIIRSLKKLHQDEARHVDDLHAEAKIGYQKYLSKLSQVQDVKPAAKYPQIAEALEWTGNISTLINSRLNTEYEKSQNIRQSEKSEARDKELLSVDYTIRKLRNIQEIYSAIHDYLNGPGIQALQNGATVIIGGWGTGKTHLLCDVTLARESEGRPTLLMLAHHIPPGQHPLDGIARVTGIARTGSALLNRLNKAGKESGKRALLIVDAINEGDREAWREYLTSIADALNEKPWVGIILSCRSPFDDLIAPKGFPNRFITAHHPGFDGIELDAQEVFFRYYDIPFPEVPLLSEEFSRPLTLKVICESFQGLEREAVKKGFNGIASGQKSMTFVLEQFIKRVGRELEDELGLPHLFFWHLLKGSKKTHSGTQTGIAIQMANDGKEYVSRAKALEIIQDHLTTTSSLSPQEILQRACAAGILTEDYVWLFKQRRNEEAVRLPYQRFSDHLIARHLLEQIKSCTDAKQIKACLKPSKPIGKVFRPAKFSLASYESPGLAEAIMAEFPERVRRVLPLEERELYFYLPKASQGTGMLCEPFIKGLSWRNPDAICEQTDQIVGHFLKEKNSHIANELLDALATLATKRNHPYSANRLWKNLSKWPLWERDLIWTEYLRTTFDSSAPQKICSWVEKSSHLVRTYEAAERLIVILSLVLTSTNRHLRDRVTRALVLLGEKHPNVLFSHTKLSLEINDPYVTERMIASCYGVLMSKQTAISNSSSLRSHVADFAAFLYAEVFKPSAKHHITHALTRDYAVGCITIAERTTGFSIRPGQRRFLKKPFRQMKLPFPDATAISDEEFEEGNSAIRMDFGNYTIGHLIEDRRNYDDKNPTYIELRRQIAWRINNLGFTKKRFETVDRLIASSQPLSRTDRTDRIDRYGKKYGWIAYFEAWGYRDANNLLRKHEEHRPSEADIDPCFPLGNIDYSPPLSFNFGKKLRSKLAWVKDGPSPNFCPALVIPSIAERPGPWVLLDGHFNFDNSSDARQLWAFCRGLLVTADTLPVFKQKFLSIPWPGNSAIPDVATDHHAFAGEIPWGIHFAEWLRNKSGDTRPHREEAFSYYETRIKREKVKQAWRRFYASLTSDEIKSSRISPRDILVGNGVSDTYRKLLDAIERANEGLAKSEQIGFFELQSQPSRDEVHSGYALVSRLEKVPGVRVELPAFNISFSGNGITDDSTNYYTLAPNLLAHCGVLYGGREAGMVDANGKTACLSIKSSSTNGRQINALYMRADLLDQYLASRNLKLVWANWGEREFHHSEIETLRSDSAMQKVWSEHLNVHKQIVLYETGGRLTELS